VKLHPATAAVLAASPPPPIVRFGPADRTPGGNGFQPPEEPEPQPRPLSPEQLAVVDMANAITDVTGMAAKLNWDKVGGLAEELVATGYTADQVRRSYSKQRVAGAWNWYDEDWRGKKGEPPSPRGIRETIAGAAHQAAPVKKMSQIERALAAYGPKPATS